MNSHNKSAKITKRRQSNSSFGVSGKGRISSSGSDNLDISLSVSPSTFPNAVGRVSRVRTEKSRSVPTKLSKGLPVIVGQGGSIVGSVGLASGMREDVAVHFGKFYERGGRSTKGDEGRLENSRTTKCSEFPASQGPRVEFTRQMFHELERLAGTEHYARQVSALLDYTVEPPDFHVQPPPAENFLSQQSSERPDYPLWYKEPEKMLSSSEMDSVLWGNERIVRSEECVVMNSVMRNITSENRRSADVTDCENNEESSSASSSELASISSSSSLEANTEEDCDDYYYNEEVPIVVQ